MYYPELDNITRDWMLVEFKKEEATGNPYRSKWFSAKGKLAFPSEMEKAIIEGNENTLAAALDQPANWKLYNMTKNGKRTSLPIGFPRALAMNEFNVWYTRGFARRLLEEGVETCVVYRAEQADIPRCECIALEGKKVTVRNVYNGHRARYHPEPGDPSVFSIPSGTNCHHSIRRLS
jgi:hypothetical protein